MTPPELPEGSDKLARHRTVSFEVVGTPMPQGSKRHVGRGVMVESGGERLRTWREDVKQAALDVLHSGVEPFGGAVMVSATFMLRRPASHWRTGRQAHRLRRGAPSYPDRKPDIDKLSRSLLDAISSAGLWRDDCQVVSLLASKLYCAPDEPPGALVELTALDSKGGVAL